MNQEKTVRVLCPYCRWEATGADIEELRRAKEHHGTHECPLPAATAPTKPAEGLPLTA
jgi:hypothetical protein